MALSTSCSECHRAVLTPMRGPRAYEAEVELKHQRAGRQQIDFWSPPVGQLERAEGSAGESAANRGSGSHCKGLPES